MKRMLLGFVLAASTTAALAALGAGDAAPMFATRASLAGREIAYSLKDELAKGPVVVYFYPSAYTGGCNIQARAFADHKDAFAAAGASIVGVSLDSIARLNDFSKDPDYCGGKITVASDADGSIAKSYGLKVMAGKEGYKDSRGEEIGHDFAERTTFIVTPDGTVAATIGGVSPAANVEQALAAVRALGKPAD